MNKHIDIGFKAANDWIIENYPDGSMDIPHPKMMEAAIKAALNAEPTSKQIEEAAKAICEVWGYLWKSDDKQDDSNYYSEYDCQVAPETEEPCDDRPSKPLFRRAAKAVLSMRNKTL